MTEENPDYATVLRHRIQTETEANPETSDATITVPVSELLSILDRLGSAESLTEPQPCNYSHEEPYDFDYCSTHDQTFERGGECNYKGMSVINYVDDSTMKQRGRAVIAEGELETASYLIGMIQGELKVANESPEDVKPEDVLNKIKGHMGEYETYINHY